MRVSVIGSSGAGKSTFGRKLAQRLGCPFVELDSIYHQADWKPLPEDQFRARVAAVVGGDSWVCDGNYSIVHPIVLERATDVVWLDTTRTMVMVQVIWRSLTRAITRRELWNGNRERVSEWLDPEHPIRWAWSTYDRRREDYARRMSSRAGGARRRRRIFIGAGAVFLQRRRVPVPLQRRGVGNLAFLELSGGHAELWAGAGCDTHVTCRVHFLHKDA